MQPLCFLVGMIQLGAQIARPVLYFFGLRSARVIACASSPRKLANSVEACSAVASCSNAVVSGYAVTTFQW